MKTKLLDLLLFSEKRKNLLILLLEGPKTLGDIRESLNVTSSGVIPQIRMLEHRNLIYQSENGYALTDTGRILTNYLKPLIKIVEIVEKNEEYWNTHDLTVLPEHLLQRLHELGNCEVDVVDLHSLYEPHRLFFESLSRSNWIMGISPVFNPTYPEFMTKLASTGKRISLILAPEVYKRSEAEYSMFKNDFLSNDTELYIYNGELRLASVITDCYFSMTLFYKDGGYDSQRNLVSTDPSAISWGQELFEHFLKNSRKLEYSEP